MVLFCSYFLLSLLQLNKSKDTLKKISVKSMIVEGLDWVIRNIDILVKSDIPDYFLRKVYKKKFFLYLIYFTPFLNRWKYLSTFEL